MAKLTLRAVQQSDRRFRIEVSSGTAEVDEDRTYSSIQVRQLADRIGAAIEWVRTPEESHVSRARSGDAAPAMTAEAEPDMSTEAEPGMSYEDDSPAMSHEASPSDDPWGGPLPPDNG